jgi:hypothetical protein
MQRHVLTAAALVLAACGWLRAGEPRQERLKWENLEARIAGKKVALVLPGGTHVEGKVIGVEAEGLRLNVSKSSNRGVQPKGKHLIPRASVSVLRVTEYRQLGRLLGTLGAAALAGGIVAAQSVDVYEGALVVIVPVVEAGGIIGSGVGGYYVGKALDKRVTEIIVVPRVD